MARQSKHDRPSQDVRSPAADERENHDNSFTSTFTSTLNMKGEDLAGTFEGTFPGEGTSFAQRLAYTIGRERVRDFATRAGLSPATVRKYLREERQEPGRDALVAMAAAGGVALDWLASGMATPYPRHAAHLPPDAYRALIVSFGRYRQGIGAHLELPDAVTDFVRRYNTDSEAGVHVERVEDLQSVSTELVAELVAPPPARGSGSPVSPGLVPLPVGVNAEGHRTSMAMTPAFAEQFLRVTDAVRRSRNDREAFAFLLRVDDQSMAPTLAHDDGVVVERITDDVPITDGIYVLEVDGAPMIRRITRRIGKGLRVFLDSNPGDYWEGEERELRQTGRIVGRVVSVVKAV